MTNLLVNWQVVSDKVERFTFRVLAPALRTVVKVRGSAGAAKATWEKWNGLVGKVQSAAYLRSRDLPEGLTGAVLSEIRALMRSDFHQLCTDLRNAGENGKDVWTGLVEIVLDLEVLYEG